MWGLLSVWDVDSLDVYEFFKDWQTLIAGILALIGAYLTVRVVRAQIRQAQTSEDQRRSREEFAARALLPLALSEAGEYAQECIRLLNKFKFIWTGQTRLGTGGVPLPKLGQNTITMLQDCARYSERDVANKIATVIAKYQVQRSRLAELFNRAVSGQNPTQKQNAITAFLDASDLYAATEELFEYGRALSTFREMRTDKLYEAMILSGVSEADQPEVFEEITRRSKLEEKK